MALYDVISNDIFYYVYIIKYHTFSVSDILFSDLNLVLPSWQWMFKDIMIEVLKINKIIILLCTIYILWRSIYLFEIINMMLWAGTAAVFYFTLVANSCQTTPKAVELLTFSEKYFTKKRWPIKAQAISAVGHWPSIRQLQEWRLFISYTE